MRRSGSVSPPAAEYRARLARGQSLACGLCQGGFSVSDQEPKGVDKVTIAYIVGGIPAIVGFVVILFTLVNLNRNIPA